MEQLTVALQVLLGAGMVLAGLAHLAGARPIRAPFTRGRLPTRFAIRAVTGAFPPTFERGGGPAPAAVRAEPGLR